MSRRVNLIGIFTITLSFCVLLFFATKNSNYYDDYMRKENISPRYKYRNYYSADSQQQQVTQNSSVTIQDVLNYQRKQIAEEMQYYEYPNGRFGVDAKNLQDLTMETNGMPMRSVIISTWRSGSTFLGDVLNTLPGNYYHYEPLLTYDIVQIRGPPHDKNAIKSLKKLLRCNYTGADMHEYLEFGASHNYLFSHNSRLWNQCQLFPNFCYQPKFLEPFCKLFPLQSMKVVRLRLKIAARLLEDTSLNVRIVLLIRDPRGFLQSRKHRVWCPGNVDCDNPNIVCKDLISDYKAAEKLAKKYPMTFKALRYEDLSLSPYDMTQEVLQFYGLAFDDRVSEFLDTHTKQNVGGVSSTFRDSKQAPFHWTKELPWNEVSYIQDSCKEAMRLWGYKEAANASELMNNFNPLLPFPDFLV
ncbi:hypothetical protein PVAND_012314 [Polypedilum vanderplanki]|uniref:Sulfotransferase domain-containing protein n=1 Tax=Polypedilum vanderplanki TaxID=319348 RepID=A0A9J6CL71_POLVA|nr:hypothetical protein PVAND_012314 [Polypedilum vanderplanki]